MALHQVSIGLDYVAGHLRYGHIETLMSDKELEEFNSLTTYHEKAEFLDHMDTGVVIDDFEVNDCGDFDFNDVDVKRNV